MELVKKHNSKLHEILIQTLELSKHIRHPTNYTPEDPGHCEEPDRCEDSVLSDIRVLGWALVCCTLLCLFSLQ